MDGHRDCHSDIATCQVWMPLDATVGGRDPLWTGRPLPVTRCALWCLATRERGVAHLVRIRVKVRGRGRVRGRVRAEGGHRAAAVVRNRSRRAHLVRVGVRVKMRVGVVRLG